MAYASGHPDWVKNPTTGQWGPPPTAYRSSERPMEGRGLAPRSASAWYYKPGETAFSSTGGTGYYQIAPGAWGNDYNAWAAAGAPIDGRGVVDPSSPDVWSHPGAFAAQSAGFGGQQARPGQTAQFASQSSSNYQTPPWWSGSPDDFASFMAPIVGQNPWAATALMSGMMSKFSSNEAQRGQNADAAGMLGGAYDDYLGRFESSRANSLGTLRSARDEFANSPTAQALTTMSQPGYQSMTDDYVAAQRVDANRAIGRSAANTIGAATALAGERGATGSGYVPQMTAAAGFRGAGDRAAINAQLLTDQLTHNETIRANALSAMSERDRTMADLGTGIAEMEGRVAAVNPYAQLQAQLISESPIFEFDPTQVLDPAELSALNGDQDAIRQIGESLVTEARAWFDNVMANAATEEERAEAQKTLDTIMNVVSGVLALIA